MQPLARLLLPLGLLMASISSAIGVEYSWNPQNNNYYQATWLTIPSSYSSSYYAIDWVGDVDWYSFTVPSAGTITITSSGTTDVKPYLYSSSTVPTTTVNDPAHDDDANTGFPSQFKVVYAATSSGTYFLKVQHYYYTSSGTGSYGLTISHQESAPTNQPPKFLSSPTLNFNSNGSALVSWGQDDPEKRTVSAVVSVTNSTGAQVSSVTKPVTASTPAYNLTASFSPSELSSLISGQYYKAVVKLSDDPPSGTLSQQVSSASLTVSYPLVFVPATLTSPSSGSKVTPGQSTYFAWNRGNADQVDIKLSTSSYGGTDAGSASYTTTTSYTKILPSVSAQTLYVQLTSWKSGQSKTSTASFAFTRPVVTYELTPDSRVVTARPGDTIRVRGGYFKDSNGTQYWAEPVIVKRAPWTNGENFNSNTPYDPVVVVSYPSTTSQLVEVVPNNVVASNYTLIPNFTYFAHFLLIYPPDLSSTLSVGLSAETWLLIHGRNDTTLGILGNDWMDMALNLRRARNAYPTPNVFRINWSTIAAREGIDLNMPYFPKMAEALNRGLNGIGALGTKNIVGHSWGTYLGYEYASRFGAGASSSTRGKVGWFIALDPATTAFGYSPSLAINFGLSSTNSWGILGTTSAIDSLRIPFGSDVLAKTAQESYILTSPLHTDTIPYALAASSYTAHSAPRIFFTQCLRGYSTSKNQSSSIYNFFTPTQPHSGIVTNRWDYNRSTTGYASTTWHEGYVEFATNSSGSAPQKLVRKNSSGADVTLTAP